MVNLRSETSRRQQILDAAAAVFTDTGYEAASMNDIANAVGVTKPTLYHHFTSKQELLFLVAHPALVDLVQRFRRIIGSNTRAEDRIRHGIVNHVTCYRDHFPHLFLISKEDDSSLQPDHERQMRELRREYQQLWERVLEEGVEKGELRIGGNGRITAFAILGACNWMYKWYDPTGPMSADELGNVFADIVLRGIQVG